MTTKEETIVKKSKENSPLTENNPVHMDSVRMIVNNAVNMVEAAEENLRKAKGMLRNIDKLGHSDQMHDIEAIAKEIKNKMRESSKVEEDSEEKWHIVYGEFDGYFMLGEDMRKYPVPLNYSSKSKLVPGDKLKLTIWQEGQLVYKLISPCERKHIRAILSKDDADNNKDIAITSEGMTYYVNQAAVVFFRGRPGDEIYITVNKNGTGKYAAIEAVIKG